MIESVLFNVYFWEYFKALLIIWSWESNFDELTKLGVHNLDQGLQIFS